MIIGKPTHASVEATAGTVEQSADFNVDYIFFVANDGTDDIYLNFDDVTTAATKITVKPGDFISEFPRNVTKLYYKSKSGNQPFRVWGVK